MMMTGSVPRGPGLFRTRTGDEPPRVTNIRRLAGAEREPGSVLVTAGMALLALLDGGLLYVVFAAQDRFIFTVKHQNAASMIQALALDAAMIIFSVLALGLARKGLPAHVERGLIVVCALASALMNWTASDHASLRSVAVYVSAPILLALVTDRVISVVRRHVLGMREDASVWARFGRRLGRAALWAARLLVDFRATRAGIRQAILAATPLPGQDEAARATESAVAARGSRSAPHVGRDDRARERGHGRAGDLPRAPGRAGPGRGSRRAWPRTAELAQRPAAWSWTPPATATPRSTRPRRPRFWPPTAHTRTTATAPPPSRVAAELAPAAGLQAGTARSYAYAELDARAAQNGAAGMSHALAVLAALPFHHLYLDGLAVLMAAALFWRFNLSGWALHANRTRAMRWRARCRLRPGPGFASLAELAVQWSRLTAAQRGGRARPSLSWRSRMFGRPHRHALRLGRAQFGKRAFASMEENWLVLSPPRKGKTGVLAEWVLKWPGAVITTSTRADVYAATAGTRYRRGPVHVFNPARVGDVPSTFGWDVVAGCADPAEAFARADALIGPRVGGQGDMAFWQDKAAIALSALLHAAALTPDADVLDIWAWCNRQGDAIAGSALAHHPAASAVLRAVFAEIQREGRSPDSVRLTMAKSLAWVAVPSVQAMVSGPMAQPFDAARFALERGTLYLIAPQGQSAAIAPLFRCFVDYAHRAATLAGSSFPAGKLDPPVLLALDEVKQVVPVPLDLWLADSAGKGVCIVAVVHGVGQLRDGWGEHGAATIWDTTSKARAARRPGPPDAG